MVTGKGKPPKEGKPAKHGNTPQPAKQPHEFSPTVGELDLHLFNEGRHRRLWRVLGGRQIEHEGVDGAAFGVWAPNARAVQVVGDFNKWNGEGYELRPLGASGIWEGFFPDVEEGAHYKYLIQTAGGAWLQKADPLALRSEEPPQTASRVSGPSRHEWGDAEWVARRGKRDHLRSPMSTYEVHLGSWRRRQGEGDDPDEDGRSLSYLEMAEELPAYVADMGFTHVELLPVAEHPFRGSWGYQVSSYFAPSARFGTPDDFRVLVDACHQAGLGVIVDWVPAHFPKDEWSLARFDGTALYEHADPRRGEHADWGTLTFNFARHEVRSFLIANALFWMEEMHIDGLRVDAVASMLYLDYSRNAGEWVPNKFGGREDLEAVEFLKELNSVVYEEHADAMTIAEESTAWPGVSRPTHLGGLGFGFKWNMGWMHDTLDYFAKQPVHRRWHHDRLTFGLVYAWQENFVLPLSHDEVVHGKGSLLMKAPMDEWRRFANVRSLLGWMWAHPGKQLIFMGIEIAQVREWSHDRSIDWHLLEHAPHRGVQDLVRELNRVYRERPALWEADASPDGFTWIDASDVDSNVLSFLRRGADGPASPDQVACIANFSPLPRSGYRVGMPFPGRWLEILNTDAAAFGGAGVGNGGSIVAVEEPWHGQPASVELDLPPMGVLWLAPDVGEDVGSAPE